MNLFLLDDPVALLEGTVRARPELGACAGVVVAAGANGIGPLDSGTYGVLIGYPEAHRGERVEVPVASLQLMAPPRVRARQR